MGLRWAFSLRAEPSFKCKFLSFQGFCLGWNRIFISLPVQPYEWAAAALWDSHLREEEKEAEDGPGRPQPTRLGQTSIWKMITFFFYVSCANWVVSFYIFRFFCECVIWEIEYGRDWNFGGLLRDCSQANPPPPLTVSNLNSSCFTRTPNCFLDFHPLFFCFPFIRSTLAIEAERIFLVQMDLWSKSLTLKRNRLEQTVEGYPQPAQVSKEVKLMESLLICWHLFSCFIQN